MKSQISALEVLPQAELDRQSFVPLYYQLQEVLKQHIESGSWRPGDLLPSEPALARHFKVSRVVVRRALAILADDNQIRREQGRGTFVAPPKLIHRIRGLSRLLAAPPEPGVQILVLDISANCVDQSTRDYLEASRAEPLLRVATQVMAFGVPFALTYSTFRQSDTLWLKDAIHPGQTIPDELTLADRGITLAHSEVVVETSQCGQFEADRFKIPPRSPVFLVLTTEYCRTDDGIRPLEVQRAEYRGDTIQLRVDGTPGADSSVAMEL